MPQEIINFWFSDAVSERWFKSTPEFDRQLTDRFEDTWDRARRGELDHWKQTAEGCLALAIVLDQFPLNMYRGEGKSFSTEALAREVARHALEQGFDAELTPQQKAFLYMPFMHSEDLADQDLCLELFDQPGLESNLKFAHHHRGIIEKFGRFPHRNAPLGRTSTEAEIEYLNSKQAFTG
jgi:uncharacterized protein (DUF924 family)